MERTKGSILSRESLIILAICLLDLLSTIWLVTTGRAIEGNPVMSFYLGKGWVTLVVAKIVLSVLPVFVLEWCRRHRPLFVHNMLRVAIAAYVGLYLGVFVNTNFVQIHRPIRINADIEFYTDEEAKACLRPPARVNIED